MSEALITTFGTAMEDIKVGQFVLIEPVGDNRVWRPDPAHPEILTMRRDWNYAVAVHDAKIGERVKCLMRGGISSGQMPE